ncbi:hypothetical protein PR048_020194 [Dryococelus australis]|uniref:CCHC-type domain-containing protein n=1 Tax=Dryococelus australis TaxID=614101 RepID=A0ABQ9H5L4_9NEOP|nr:hypothetical protein PR048_020194 [Dryococelus australis]
MKCHEMHALHRCPQFLNGNLQELTYFVSLNKLCFNCLQVGHIERQCASVSSSKFGRKHNALLHREAKSPQVEDQEKASRISVEEKGMRVKMMATIEAAVLSIQSHILLPTATVRVCDNT